MPDSCKMVQMQSVAFFPSLKHNFIAYRSFKVSDYIFVIPHLWQSGFCWVYSKSCCSYWFEPEIIKIGLSSHKMYSNNIMKFQESTSILNAHMKKVCKLIVCTSNLSASLFQLNFFVLLSIPLSLFPWLLFIKILRMLAFCSKSTP